MHNEKIFLIGFIFTLVSSKTNPSVQLGVNTTFDRNNNLFEFNYNGKGKDLILFNINPDEEYLYYDIECPDDTIGRYVSYTSGDSVLMLQSKKKGTCSIYFYPEDKNKGSFLIRLKNKYGNLVPSFIREEEKLSISQLTFLVPNLDRNVIVIFEYTPYAEIRGDIVTVNNPFKVCQGKKCEENIETYEFTKGKSYEIIIKLSNVKDEFDHYFLIMPGFTFYDEQYNENYSPDDIIDAAYGLKLKLFFISLILLLL